MSALSKAASRFDVAFAALAPNVREAAMLAIYRAAPAIEQYQRDLKPLTESPELIDALWDLAIAAGWKIATKGKDGIGKKQLEEMRGAAPLTSEFLERTGRLIAGVLPGFGGPFIDAAEAPVAQIAARSTPEPDE